jgi:hypothetical protein
MERTRTTTLNGAFIFQHEVQTTPSDRFGGVIGAGAEWMPFGPNWIGRLEYLHYDFGRVRDTTTTVTNVPGTLPTDERRGRQTLDIVRAVFPTNSSRPARTYCTFNVRTTRMLWCAPMLAFSR